jgi:hypothetical protein
MNRTPLTPEAILGRLFDVSEAVAYRMRGRKLWAFERCTRAQRLLLYWWKRGIEREERLRLQAEIIEPWR